MNGADRLPWFSMMPRGGGFGGPHERHLRSICLISRTAGDLVLGARNVLLNDARGSHRRTGTLPPDVVLDARVFDGLGGLQWYGDLDVAARADELQLVSDLLAQPVHIDGKVDSSHPHRAKGCASFQPTQLACHPLAPFDRIRLRYANVIRYPWATSRAAVDWHAVRPWGRAFCFMRFGPHVQPIPAEATTTVPGSPPALGSAVAALAEQILREIAAAGLVRDDGPEPLAVTIERYVWHAISQVAELPAVAEAWTKPSGWTAQW